MKTYSRRFEKGSNGEYAWTPFSGGSFSARGAETYDLWFYEKRAVTLIFNRQGELVYWHRGPDPPNEKFYETDKIN